MSQLFNVYCDESCHLEGDHIPVMVLGAVWCPQAISGKIARDIRAIQVKHGLKPDFEIKWTKVSQAKQSFYCELVEYFFANPNLQFRGVVVPDKAKLDHAQFGQNHDQFYYKMFFYVLRNVLENGNKYRIYLDIKDTQGRERLGCLTEVLQVNSYHKCIPLVMNRDTIMPKRTKAIYDKKYPRIELTGKPNGIQAPHP